MLFEMFTFAKVTLNYFFGKFLTEIMLFWLASRLESRFIDLNIFPVEKDGFST